MSPKKTRIMWVVLSVSVLAVLLLWTLQLSPKSTAFFQTILGTRENTHSHERVRGRETLPPSSECASCPASESEKETADERKSVDRACRELLQRAAVAGDPNPDTRHLNGCRGKTPLHFAKAPAHVLELLAAGADPNAQDALGNSPLHDAARRRKSPEFVKELLDAGADAKLRNRLGNTPLQWMKGTPDRRQFLHSRFLMVLKGQAWKKGIAVDQFLEQIPAKTKSQLLSLESHAKWGSKIEALLIDRTPNPLIQRGQK